MHLSPSYEDAIKHFKEKIAFGECFDILAHTLSVGNGEVTFFYIDGFVKDAQLEKLMGVLINEKTLAAREEFVRRLPQIEVSTVTDEHDAVHALLCGQTVLFSSSFVGECLLLDLRTYPTRSIQEPESDRVMQGARDGFVETLIFNTVLVRRRLRDPRLRMKHFTVGGSSGTDVVLCYMDGVAKSGLVRDVEKKLRTIRPKTLTLGFQSLAECFLRRGWLNPFPKMRSTERPDTAAAELAEGAVLVLCDTSPQAMILPTSAFDYLQQTDDFYFPPLTGTYLRLVRTLIFLLSVVATPLWMLAIQYQQLLPPSLSFIIPEEAALPLLVQLLLVEVAIDGLKIASLNTPNTLSSSLSIIGGLILGDFAVGVGWLTQDVILYMAFVAVATFAGQNPELGYALKFVRILSLLLTAAFGIYGFVVSMLVFVILLISNRTATGRNYLYPLIPFDPKALWRLFVRVPKYDFEDTES